MTKPNVVLIHGAYGYPDENWFSWLKHQLNEIEIDCLVPHMPTPEGQNLARWLELFNNNYSYLINENTILIGHSLGAAFILRWLEQAKINIKHSILVGSFMGNVGIKNFDDINQSFFKTPFMWDSIQKACKQFFCYHGSNDPYVSNDNFQLIADSINAKKIIISNGGHLNTSAGYTSFPQLFLHLKQIIQENYND